MMDRFENQFEDDMGLVRPDVSFSDDDRDFSLRPKFLKEFLGQTKVKNNLHVFIEAAKSRQEPMDHLFLIGPPGLGKTTLAQITAMELGADFKVTSAPALEKPKDLAGILSTITEGTVFFIDEIHRLKPAIEEMLYIAMEDYEDRVLDEHVKRADDGCFDLVDVSAHPCDDVALLLLAVVSHRKAEQLVVHHHPDISYDTGSERNHYS